MHAIEPRSRANGPGVRFVVWLQGCTLGCPGCFNPATHSLRGRALDIESIDFGDADGLSLSGGEPMQQPEAALALIAHARSRGLSTLMFSGYTQDEIRAQVHGPAILGQLDVLIDGRYVASERLATGLRGSANQRIHLLTPRHTLAEVEATPVAEVRIGPKGDVILTGVDPLALRASLRK
jgi:anaerobic ribonucleoside-triphosphate reductase activating protein